MEVLALQETYIQTPNLPKKRVRLVLIDHRVHRDVIKYLTNKNIIPVETITCNELYEAVQGHPDMVLHHLGGKDIVIAPNVIDYYKVKLEAYGFHVITGNTYLKRNYPNNIAYNVCRVGNFIIHNFKYTDEVLLNYFEEQNYTKIHVAQGYSKCSVAVIHDKAIITSDIAIHKEVTKFGIDSLLISPGDIILPKLNYGFIGGTCGYLSNKDLAFFGDPRFHKEFDKISNFLKKYNKNIVVLRQDMLQDYGTLVPLIEMD